MFGYDQAMRRSPGGAALFQLLRERITGERVTRSNLAERIRQAGEARKAG